MDTRTGQIHQMHDGETFKEFSKRVGVPEQNLTPLRRQPDPKCAKCHGKGYKPRPGQKPKKQFKLFTPCACTL